MEKLTEQWTGQFCASVNAEKREKVVKVLKDLVLNADDVAKIMKVFTSQMDLANGTDEGKRKQSDLLMDNTHVRCLMDGTESGDYLGLDLGGTNFRVVLIRLKKGVAETTMDNYTIPSDVLCGPTKGVFDFIANKIMDFFEKHDIDNRKEALPLGFTFSFPSTQVALNSSRLVTWTKSFKCPDGVGEDPVKLLEQALQRRGLADKVDVVAVMNDTTSTLLAGNYIDKKARIGVILGTGSNAAFVDHVENIERWTGDTKDPKEVVVVVEWGCAGDNGCLDFYRTQYEKEVDNSSNHVGSYTFEKSFSGLYLGELVRLVLVRLTQEGALFDGNLPQSLSETWSLTTSHVTEMERDESMSTMHTREALKQLQMTSSEATEDDVAIIREVAAMISRRAAYIVAAAIAALVNRTQLPDVTVAIDGSLYENHPKFHSCMMDILNTFCPKSRVKLILVKDGSGLGAGFVAVSALKQNAAQLRCS
ncbi:hexokinase type 2-like [Littorina saxatilis]|uniref:Phosphotransferase n=1 Tax=Littorina saxatilis TaxID=31220 RepID=A0AAN9BN60_9CAEN